MENPAPAAAFGINLVAAVRGNVGMGVTARNLAKVLKRHGIPFSLIDVRYEWGGELPLGELEAHLARDGAGTGHPVSLYVLPPGAFGDFFQRNPWLLGRPRLHVAALWWEASALPPAWIEDFSRFDAVITGSGFLTNLAANQLTLTPVIEVPQPLALPDGIAADRARFGLPADAVAFVASLDPNSDPARKNPVALVRAFRMAFPPGSGNARLAIRMHNAATDLGRAALDAVTQAAAGDARIACLLEPMDYETVLSFYASGDAYVSLHRGEGLGLGLMEAMALGKPVIATAWSGNMSFMDYTCGCPVRYRRTPVSGFWSFLRPEFIGRDAFWAEPMLDDAAGWMRRLHDDAALRRRLGEAAGARIAAYQAEAWGRRWIDALAALLEAQRFLPKAPGKYSGAAG